MSPSRKRPGPKPTGKKTGARTPGRPAARGKRPGVRADGPKKPGPKKSAGRASGKSEASKPKVQNRTVFASVNPGLEEALMDELTDLGFEPRRLDGGCEVKVDATGLYAIQLWSRLAGKVLVRVASVDAPNLQILAKAVSLLPWRDYVVAGQPVDVRVKTTRSRIRRSDNAARKVEHAITDALRGPRKPGPRPPKEPMPVAVRIEGNRATISVDASGELLHKRGWRQATASAPLRENIAACVLRLAGWMPGETLVDPMCGSGTFAIEAAGIAAGHAPGANRAFACERWPSFDAQRFGALKAEAAIPNPVARGRIIASDRDERAIAAANDNARRAGVHSAIEFRHARLDELEPPQEKGLIVVNPPWGRRLGFKDRQRVFGAMGRTLRENWPGWNLNG